MIKLNFGCGSNLLKGFINIDKEDCGQPKEYKIDILKEWPFEKEYFDFILVNHVLCTMTYEEAQETLFRLFNSLDDGGIIQIIDMDLLKAIKAYNEGRPELVPIADEVTDEIEEKLCLHISGLSTRKSLYTPNTMSWLVQVMGLRDIKRLDSSPYDLRPNESLIIEGER